MPFMIICNTIWSLAIPLDSLKYPVRKKRKKQEGEKRFVFPPLAYFLYNIQDLSDGPANDLL